MSRTLPIFFLVSMVVFLGCQPEEESEEPAFDWDAQNALDREIIDQYLIENELEVTDTTDTGGRFIIMASGDGDTIHYNDIVSYDFIGSDVEGNIFTSSIEAVTDTIENVFTNVTETFTYTESGWTLSAANSTMLSGVYGSSLEDAINAAFIHMQVNGHLRVILPSFEGRRELTPPNSEPYAVLIYDIFVVDLQ